MGEERGLGKHLVADFLGCPAEVLDDIETLRELLLQAAEAAGSHVIGERAYKFSPQGASVVILVEESHLAIHTWPEYGYAAVDIFTCGAHTDPWRALEMLKKVLKPKCVSVMEIRRGVSVERGERQRQ